MLLGIGLHAAIPFVPWRGEADTGVWLLDVFVGFVHGFRMPLFFLISGFFTAMLWRRRGLRSLIRHRLRRVGLPLLVGLVTVLPAVWVGIIAGWVISGAWTLEDLESGEAVGGYEQQLEDDLGAGGRDDADDSARARGEGDDQAEGEKQSEEQEFGFAHMWFLWILLWQAAGFAAVAAWAKRRALRRGAERPLSQRAAARILWSLPVLSVLPQLAMTEGGFGPDTSEAFIPALRVLLYYACFFGFGALAYDHLSRGGTPLMDAVGRRWAIQLAVAAFVLFPAGIVLIEDAWGASALLQIAFAWTMSFGLIGLFRRFMARRSFRVHYLSDASYWMYLAHLPLVFVAQGIVARLAMPALVDFVVVCASVTALLLVVYRYLVRYTFVGRLLNGRRTRAADQASRDALAAAR